MNWPASSERGTPASPPAAPENGPPLRAAKYLMGFLVDVMR